MRVEPLVAARRHLRNVRRFHFADSASSGPSLIIGTYTGDAPETGTIVTFTTEGFETASDIIHYASIDGIVPPKSREEMDGLDVRTRNGEVRNIPISHEEDTFCVWRYTLAVMGV